MVGVVGSSPIAPTKFNPCRSQAYKGFLLALCGALRHALMESCILKDPVCGMTVTDKSFYYLEHGGQTHFFCGPKCKARFAADVPRYTGVTEAEAEPAEVTAPQRKFKWSRGWTLAFIALVALLLVLLSRL